MANLNNVLKFPTKQDFELIFKDSLNPNGMYAIRLDKATKMTSKAVCMMCSVSHFYNKKKGGSDLLMQVPFWIPKSQISTGLVPGWIMISWFKDLKHSILLDAELLYQLGVKKQEDLNWVMVELDENIFFLLSETYA